MEKISVIVPVYNMELHLRECIESLINQTYKNIEVLLVDDGSIDSSGKICDEYAKVDLRVKVYHIKNSGPAKARNYALKKITGDYVIFLDSDDWLEKETLQECYDAIELYKDDMILFNLCDFIGDKVQEHHVLRGEIRHFKGNEIEYIKDMLLTKRGEGESGTVAITGIACKMYRKQVIENCVFPEEFKIGEDACFLAQVLENVKSLLYIDKVFYHRRIVAGSLSNGYKGELGRGKYVNWLVNFYKGKKSDELFNQFCFINYILVAFRIMQDNEIGFKRKRKIILEFLDGIEWNYNFMNVEIQTKNRNMRVIQQLLKKKKLFLVWAVFKLRSLWEKLGKKVRR